MTGRHDPPRAPETCHGDTTAHARGAATVAPIARVALSVDEACAALGVSWDFWNAHIASDVRLVRRGRRKLVPVRELERWLDESAERVLERR